MKSAKLDDETAVLINIIRGRLLLDNPSKKYKDVTIIKLALQAYKEAFKWKTNKKHP